MERWRVPPAAALALGAVLLALLNGCQNPGSYGETAVNVSLTTNLGEIVVELYPEKAPVTASNFLGYVDAGAYDRASFYRVVRRDTEVREPAIQVIQGGVEFMPVAEQPLARAPINHETTQHTGLKHEDGAISMARGEVGTATTEFFICIGAQPSLDHGGGRNPDGQGFAVFGRVIAGMDVVRSIQAQPGGGDVPAEWADVATQILIDPVIIESARRLPGR